MVNWEEGEGDGFGRALAWLSLMACVRDHSNESIALRVSVQRRPSTILVRFPRPTVTHPPLTALIRDLLGRNRQGMIGSPSSVPWACSSSCVAPTGPLFCDFPSTRPSRVVSDLFERL